MMLTEPAVQTVVPRPRPRPSRGRAGIAAVGWAATVPMVAWLAFAHGLPQRLNDVSEPYAKLVVVAFFGQVFTFHLGLALAVVAGVSLAASRRRLAAVAGVAAAFALWPAAAGLLPRHPPAVVGRPLRVMSMNVKWVAKDPASMVEQVRAADPDVVALVDYTELGRRAVAAVVGADHPYRSLNSNNGQGLALYSRLPFDGPPEVVIAGFRRHVRVVVRLAGRPVALYLVHPYSPRSERRILNNRQAVADLADRVAAETVPVVVVGDFNFPPGTANEAALRTAGLSDAFTLAGGAGRGSTWPARPTWAGWLPGVRIDHCFVSAPTLTCTRLDVGRYDGSDHYPIVADVGFANP